MCLNVLFSPRPKHQGPSPRGSTVKTSTLILAACLIPSAAQCAAPAPSQSVIKHGEYLVTVIGCSHCHTPMKMGPNGAEPDMALFLSGHPAALKMPTAPKLPQGPWLITVAGTNTAFAGPWGVSFTANLTSDKATGLGSWTEKDFITAIRTGKHKAKGRNILPPMPWQDFKNATDSDLKAMFAYLQSTKPITNAVPDAVEPPPH